MIHKDKLEELKIHLKSLETLMTPTDKFWDRSYILFCYIRLLLGKMVISIPLFGGQNGIFHLILISLSHRPSFFCLLPLFIMPLPTAERDRLGQVCTRAATSISAARRGTVTMARTATPCPRYRHGKHTGQANQLFSIRTYCFNFGYYPIKINYPRHKIWEKPELVLADHYIGTHLFPPFFFTCHVLCQTLLSLAIHIEIFIVLKPIWIIYYGSVFY